MMRALAIVAGLVLLASATWAVIVDASLSGPHAALVAAMAFGTGIGALVLARSSWRVGAVILIAVLTGETYGMLATAERIIQHRETQAAAEARASPATARARDDLAAARAAIVRHDDAARQRISEKSCATECRRLLDQTRLALVADRDAAAAALVIAPGRSTPLADRLGVAPWIIDLIAAGLLAVGANGLACVLIAWGAHAPQRRPHDTHNDPVPGPDGAQRRDDRHHGGGADCDQPAAAEPGRVIALRRRANGRDARRFALERLRPDAAGAVPLKAVAEAYWAWCDGQSLDRPDMAATVAQIMGLFGSINVDTELTPQRDVIARGIALTG